jgi:hypothetical protein
MIDFLELLFSGNRKPENASLLARDGGFERKAPLW